MVLQHLLTFVGGTGIPHIYALVRRAIEKQVTHGIYDGALVAHRVSFAADNVPRVIGSWDAHVNWRGTAPHSTWMCHSGAP